MEPIRPERSTTFRVDTRILAGAATTLLILGACTSGADTVNNRPAPEASDPTSGTATQQIRVTRDTDRGPDVCHPRQVGETVVKHFEAINQRDTDRAMNHVAPQLGWYSVTEGNPRDGGRHFVTRDSDKLREYFDRRIAQNERIYLLEIDIAYERARDIAHVAYNLLRTADDLTDYAKEAGGKGAIGCDNGRIAVWSMGQGPRPQLVGDLCPENPHPPKTALACARR